MNLIDEIKYPLKYKGVVYDTLFITKTGDCFKMNNGKFEPMQTYFTGKNRSYKSVNLKIGNKHHLALLHRIMYETFVGEPNGFIDHIDRNSLNNNISNLRIATQQQNTWNRGASKNSSLGLKGIVDTGTSYRVEIRKDGKKAFQGNYRTLKEACKVYNEKSKEFHGEFAFQHDIENIRRKKKQSLNYCLDI